MNEERRGPSSEVTRALRLRARGRTSAWAEAVLAKYEKGTKQ